MEAALAEWVRCRLFMVDPEFTYNDKKLYSYRDAVRKIAGDKALRSMRCCSTVKQKCTACLSSRQRMAPMSWLRLGSLPEIWSCPLSTVPVNNGLAFRTGTMMPHELQCGA